ncbi:MAG TPA: phosphoribosylglycinamide formyltransferase [Gemmatimonadaceae bacterium]|jgi:formyltetrahydrofolate-dependent phosphoribosylglycinamide formyltransferase|nr:phosphoribosylglycinamide formyltransferase [Gemmatimonadaceae bacterium]
MTVRIAVLASGRGTNLQALIDHFSHLGAHSPATIELVASNKENAPALDRARNASIAAESFTANDEGSELLELLARYRIELVVLAGYMKRIPPSVVSEFHGRIVNVHPGLLPEFGGAGMYGARVHQAVLASGALMTGVTVHLVDDEFDHGPVVVQWRVKVKDDDTAETLAARVLEVEHAIYPKAVEMIASLNQRKLSADF